MSITPLGNKALIKEVEKDKVSKGGLVIPDNASDGNFSTRADVLAVGPGKMLENGTVVPSPLKVGDRIVLRKHLGTEVTIGGEDHRIVDMDQVDGVIKD
jgi:chaperonin GroES